MTTIEPFVIESGIGRLLATLRGEDPTVWRARMEIQTISRSPPSAIKWKGVFGHRGSPQKGTAWRVWADAVRRKHPAASSEPASGRRISSEQVHDPFD